MKANNKQTILKKNCLNKDNLRIQFPRPISSIYMSAGCVKQRGDHAHFILDQAIS